MLGAALNAWLRVDIVPIGVSRREQTQCVGRALLCDSGRKFKAPALSKC
jgi:hypothetical protein